MRNGEYHVGFWNNDCAQIYASTRGVWEHVAFVYDKTAQTQTVLVNGVMRKQCESQAPYTGTNTVYLGAFFDEHRHWIGKIKDVKIFNRALPGEEIDSIAQGIHRITL